MKLFYKNKNYDNFFKIIVEYIQALNNLEICDIIFFPVWIEKYIFKLYITKGSIFIRNILKHNNIKIDLIE